MLSFLVLFVLEHKVVIGEAFFLCTESEFMVCSLPLLPTSLPGRRKQWEVSCLEWLKKSQDVLGFPLVLKEDLTVFLALISKPSLKCIHIVVFDL